MNRYRGRRQSDFQRAEWRRTDYARGAELDSTDNSLAAGDKVILSGSTSSEINRFRGSYELTAVVTDSDDTATDPSHFATLWLAIGVIPSDVSASESPHTFDKADAQKWRRVRTMNVANIPFTFRGQFPNLIVREDEQLIAVFWQSGLPSSGQSVHYRFTYRGWYQIHDY